MDREMIEKWIRAHKFEVVIGIVALIALCVLFNGCEEMHKRDLERAKQYSDRITQERKKASQICIAKGGIPIFDYDISTNLRDCKFKGDEVSQ